MIKLIILIVFRIAIISPIPSYANGTIITGNELYSDCQSTREDPLYWVKQNSCRGFVVGSNDAYTVSFALGLTKRLFCSPNKVTVGQLTDVVVRFMELNPAKRNSPASVLALIAWQKAYPCEATDE